MKVKESAKRRRFLKLLRKFRELPEERFDLKAWIIENLKIKVSSPKFLLEHPCGTTGCLAGWVVAWFPRHWRYSEHGQVPTLNISESSYDRNPGFYMAEYFGGTYDDWARIIYQSYYRREMIFLEGRKVPKHLVMNRLTELYNKLYKK